jgi:uncharacterized membrane protein
LAHLLGYLLILFGFSGILWLGAVYLQIQMRNLSIKALEQNETLPLSTIATPKFGFCWAFPHFLRCLE